MKLSTKGRYSVTALYELALHYGEGVVPIKTIAKSQGISENYLEQLMLPLRRAGLVERRWRGLSRSLTACSPMWMQEIRAAFMRAHVRRAKFGKKYAQQSIPC